MQTIYLGFGSNEGDRVANLQKAIAMLSPHIETIAISDVFESEPYGVEGEQPRYLNLALRGATELSAADALAHLKSIEHTLGRKPNTHNLPRPIDIDILLFGDLVHETSELSIPHPRMHERAFVLAPLMQIASLAVHPVRNVVIADLDAALGDYSSLVWIAQEKL